MRNTFNTIYIGKAYMSYISVQKLSQWCKPSFQTETTHWNSSISFGSHFFTRFIHHVYLVLLRPCAKCGIFAFEYHVIKNISYLKIKTYERCMCFSSKVISKTHDFIANYALCHFYALISIVIQQTLCTADWWGIFFILWL